MRRTRFHFPRWLIFLLAISSILLATLACSVSDLMGETPSQLAPEGDAGIAGRVWHDRCANPPIGEPLPDEYPPGCVFDSITDGLIANSLLDPDEPGLQSVELALATGICPGEPLTSTSTAPDGMYLFAGLAAGTYCVTIDPGSEQNATNLGKGRWTYPSIPEPSGPMSVNVVLEGGEVRADVYFAWDHAAEPVYEAAPVLTPTINLTPSVTPTNTITPTPSATPEPEGSPTPTATPTFSVSDPRPSLGEPTWEDDLTNDGDWFLYSDEHVSFEMVDGQMEMKAYRADFYSGWSLGWRKDSNMYVEATLKVLSCSDRDAVGLVFRAPDVGRGYLFGVSCDGRFSLRLWDGSEMTRLQDWTSHPALLSGSDQTQRVAVWTNGNLIRLYANGELLKELYDSTYTEEGLFGVFISSAVTTNFEARLTEFLYWNAP